MKSTRKFLQLRLRHLLFVILIFSCLLAWYEIRYLRVHRTWAFCEANGMYVFSLEEPEPSYLPAFLQPPPPIEGVGVTYKGKGAQNVAKAVEMLRVLGTVRELHFRREELTPADLREFSKLKTITIVKVERGCSDAQLEPLLSLPLEEYIADREFSVITEYQFRKLVELKTLKKIGGSDFRQVPRELRRKYPNLKIEITDIW